MCTKRPQHVDILVFGVSILLCSVQISTAEFEECANVDGNAFVALDGDCFAYIYCDGSASYTDRCPGSSHFDAARQRCSMEESSLCRKANATLAPTTLPQTFVSITAVPTMATTALPERPHCNRDIDEYFPHPLRCEYYYRCEHGFLTIMHCNFHYGWDYVQQLCVPMKDARCYVGEHTVKLLSSH